MVGKLKSLIEDELETKKFMDSLANLIQKEDVENFKLLAFSNIDTVRENINRRDESYWTLLHHAVELRQEELVKILVETFKADVNAKDKDGLTPLHVAAKLIVKKNANLDMSIFSSEEEDKVAELIEGLQDSEKEELSDDVFTPEAKYLIIQIMKRHKKGFKEVLDAANMDKVFDPLIHYLIKQGALVNQTDYAMNEPIHYAVSRYNDAGVRQLIKDGADVDCRDIQGMTPLMRCIERGIVWMLKILLENCASITAMDQRYNNIIHHAAKQKGLMTLLSTFTFILVHDAELAKRMLNAQNVDLNTPLHIASDNGYLEAMVSMIAQGADLKLRNDLGQVPLHLIVPHWDDDMTSLLETGMDVNAADDKGKTPLFYAARSDNTDAAEALLKFGASVDYPNYHKQTALMIAAQEKSLKMFELLIEKGANVELKDDEGKGILLHAVERKTRWKDDDETNLIIDKILENEAISKIINESDIQGNTVLHYAALQGNTELLDKLLYRGADEERLNRKEQAPIHFAVQSGVIEAVERLMSETYSYLWDDGDGNSPLHYAARQGDENMIKMMLKQGDSKRSRSEINADGQTPLLCATKSGKIKCVEVLLEGYEGDVNVLDRSNCNALFHACINGQIEMVELLLGLGGDPSIRASKQHEIHPNWNALNVAVDKKHLDCVTAIINSNFYFQAMNNTFVSTEGNYETSFTHMVNELPDAATLVMDKCVTRNRAPKTHADYQITYNFEFLQPQHEKVKKKSKCGSKCCGAKPDDLEAQEMERVIEKNEKDNSPGRILRRKKVLKLGKPLEIMVATGQEKLLLHELVHSLITYKWIRLIGPYLANVFLYLFFISLLTSFMMLTYPPYMILPEMNSSISDHCLLLQKEGLLAYKYMIEIPKYGTMVFAIINLIKELVQLFRSGWSYFVMENFIEVTIYSLSIAVTVDTNECMRATGLRENWQWQVGVVALTLAWFNVLLFTQKSTPVGIYVGTFTVILTNLAKLAFVFLPFLIAFMLAFHLLLANQFAFTEIETIPKVAVMIAGEVDLGGAMHNRFGADAGREVQVAYPTLTYVVYFMFISLIVICLMNMVTGIAVGDVNDIQSQANVERLRMTIQTLSYAEGILESLRLTWASPRFYNYRPNDEKKFMDLTFHWIFTSTEMTAKAE